MKLEDVILLLTWWKTHEGKSTLHWTKMGSSKSIWIVQTIFKCFQKIGLKSWAIGSYKIQIIPTVKIDLGSFFHF